MRNLSIPALAVLLMGAPAAAFGQSCAGVELRVNARTLAMQGVVISTTTAAEAALIAEEFRQRALLLSAIRVLTAQSSTSGDQNTIAIKQTEEAVATTYATQHYRQAIADASHRYGSVGYDPCAVNATSKTLYKAVTTASSARTTIVSGLASQPGKYGDQSQWVQETKKPGIDGFALYSGDVEKAKAYINVVIGPPDSENPTLTGTAAADVERLAKAGRDAQKSLSATVLADIAADHAKGGPIERAQELSKHWIGDDGGEKWAAAIAGDHQRGVLQDAVRIEAANLAMLALQIQKGMRTEASAAALLLAMVNAGIKPSTPPLPHPTSQKAGFSP